MCYIKRTLRMSSSNFIYSLTILFSALFFFMVERPVVAAPLSFNSTEWNFYENDAYDSTEHTIINANKMTIKSAGDDVWTGSDQYATYYLDDIEGDFVAKVKIASQTYSNDWAKAGFMVRNDITNDGQSTGYCVMSFTPSSLRAFQWDSNDNGFLDQSEHSSSPVGWTYPVWLAIQKTGTSFRGYYSYDNVTWTELENQNIPSANNIQDLGIFVCSHSSGTPCTVQFEDFEIAPLPSSVSYTIDASAGANGAITPAGSTEVTENDDQVYIITPDAHYEVDTVTADGGDVTAALVANTYTFATVTANHTIHATFKQTTHTITASVSGGNGSISPSGTMTVIDGNDQIFYATASAGYEIDQVTVDGGAASLTNDRYTFSNVTADHTIILTFQVAPADPDVGGIPGCATSKTSDNSSGFDLADFDYTNVGVGASGYLALQTGNQAINPEDITIPFTQEVSVTFLYEGAGYVSDFGWILYDDAVNTDGSFKGWTNIPENKKRPLFIKIYDDNEQGSCCGGGNGILDTDYGNGGFPTADEAALAVYDDGTGYPFIVDGDGIVTAKDMKKNLGTIAGGTEVVFFLTANKRWNTSDTNGVFFSKKDWNPDTYGACGSGTFTKMYRLGLATAEGGCDTDDGWMAQPAIDRLDSIFGVTLPVTATYELPITWGAKYSHNIVGAPPDDPNQWILGWEDLMGGGDSDHNDMVFKIDRKTGGIAQLESSEAIVPDEANAYFTAVTFEVYDNMPCAGQTSITYSISIDNGDTWVDIDNWDVIKSYSIGAGVYTLDAEPNDVANWTPGTPQYVYRSRRVDFAGLGQAGRALIWKAELSSEDENCSPEVVDVLLDANVATHGNISRSSPIVQTNLLYSGYFETPDLSWTDKQPRGHVLATRIYDPVDPSTTENAEIWDAGQSLTDMNPDSRNIYFPTIVVTSPSVPSASVTLMKGDGCVTDCITTTGDGVTRTFSGTLNHPVVATSVTITDTHESFNDSGIEDLNGSYGGTGTLNRYNGIFTVVFKDPPADGVPIQFSYAYYSTTGTLNEFTTANITNAHLGLDDEYILPQGYTYDLNGDDVVTEADGDWLVKWVRGYSDGASTKKEWLLGPVDHSTPAVATPPGTPFWYFGTATTHEEKESFDQFIDAHKDRRTVLYVGARDGMLHAFDAGKLQWDDNPETTVEEQRGYFEWGETDPLESLYNFLLKSTWDSILARYADPLPDFDWEDSGTKAPDYGTGQELWAFIPSNLLARLKNNLLKAEDQSYVDASPAISDVYVNGAWRTLLLAAEGNGGDTVFCLDITDPSSPPAFLWEFADPELFRSRSSPAIGKIGRILVNGVAKWVAFFVSGMTYDPDLDPSIYIIDIADGTVLERIYLHAGVDSNIDGIDDGQGGVPSGQPAIIDSDGNGYIDRMYIGTDKGFMFKVNLPDDPDVPKYSISQCVINMDFDYVDSSTVEHSVPVAQQRHPIYASPSVVVDNTYDEEGELSYNIRVFYGTGDSPYFDENINTGNTNYYFFAYSDTDEKGECITYDADEDEYSVGLSWFLTLDAEHRVFASAFAAAGTVYFGTSTSETEDPCTGPNEGRIYGINMITGEIILNEEVGNITTTPTVEDEHLYYKTVTTGGKTPEVKGQGGYNNDPVMGGTGQASIQSWLHDE